MKIRDKSLRVLVDVSDKDCPSRPCYWPRLDPGVFTQGVGYRTREGKREWLCGRREITGCPRKKRVCRICGCTDDDCSGCIERTGHPCSWTEPDLCSACVEKR